MKSNSKKRIKVLYAEGPGNIVETFRLWTQGKDDPHQQCVTYSGQIYEACKQLDTDLLAVSKHQEIDSFSNDLIQTKNVPTIWMNGTGLKYFLGRFVRGLYLFKVCLEYKPNIAFITEANTFWFMLNLLTVIGVKVVPVIHCALWPQSKGMSKINRLIFRLSRSLLTYRAYGILTISSDISRQVEQIRKEYISSTNSSPIIEFLPFYRKSAVHFKPNDPNKKPFHVLFIGRIETNKGIYQLLDIAKRLKKDKLSIQIDIAGTGSQLEQLRSKIKSESLDGMITTYGYCYQNEMKELVAKSHIFIVPTTSDIVEGFNMVSSECILANRPLIVSSVCPAIEYVNEAALVVDPDDIDGYYKCIRNLYFDPDLYSKKCIAASKLHHLFLSKQNSFESAVTRIISSYKNGVNPTKRLIDTMS